MSDDRWTVMLPKDAPAVRTARQAVERWLDGEDPRVLDDARHVVTELVSNAVRYGRPPIELSVRRGGDALRIEVADAGVKRPHANEEPGPDGGWGLQIVGGLSDRWGVADDASRVWCEVAFDGSGSPAA
jgi:anti-sigma regulatory factor (Ser/Thr protein kinase)